MQKTKDSGQRTEGVMTTAAGVRSSDCGACGVFGEQPFCLFRYRPRGPAGRWRPPLCGPFADGQARIG